MIQELKEKLEKERISNSINTSKEVPPISKKKKKKSLNLKNKILIGGVATAIGGGVLLSEIPQKENESKRNGDQKEINIEDTKGIVKKDETKTKKIDFIQVDSSKKETTLKEPDLNKKIFNQEIFNTLPEQGKEIYKFFAEHDPTPGYGYQILDKDSARIFIFDKNNYLKGVVTAGFGKDLGDTPNSSDEYNKGVKTTPAGAYIISGNSTPEDLVEYGKLQYSLFGVSVLGDHVSLGEHQTYSKHGEIERRTPLLESLTPDDNNFSDGCVNIDQNNFLKHIKPFFKANCREIFFILQDKVGKKSGHEFNVKWLLKKVMPIMLKTAEIGKNNKKNKENFKEVISKYTKIVNNLSTEIENMTKEQGKMVDEWRKNKSKEKESKIAEINRKIKETRKKLSDARKFMNFGEKGLKDIEILENKTKEIMNL